MGNIHEIRPTEVAVETFNYQNTDGKARESGEIKSEFSFWLQKIKGTWYGMVGDEQVGKSYHFQNEKTERERRERNTRERSIEEERRLTALNIELFKIRDK